MADAQRNSSKADGLRRGWLGFAWAVLVTAALVLMTKFNVLPDAPDKWSYDWRTYFFSPRAPAQRSDIALVLINEDSVADYPYNVVDRGLLADLVRALKEAGAKAIGLDFVFERQTELKK